MITVEGTTKKQQLTVKAEFDNKPQVITVQMVDEAVAACMAYAAASKAKNEAEKERERALSVVFEIALGTKTMDEVKAMSPEKVQETVVKRLAKKLFSFGKVFKIKKSHEGIHPSYQSELTKLIGESGIKELQQNTLPTFGYVITE